MAQQQMLRPEDLVHKSPVFRMGDPREIQNGSVRLFSVHEGQYSVMIRRVPGDQHPAGCAGEDQPVQGDIPVFLPVMGHPAEIQGEPAMAQMGRRPGDQQLAGQYRFRRGKSGGGGADHGPLHRRCPEVIVMNMGGSDQIQPGEFPRCLQRIQQRRGHGTERGSRVIVKGVHSHCQTFCPKQNTSICGQCDGDFTHVNTPFSTVIIPPFCRKINS